MNNLDFGTFNRNPLFDKVAERIVQLIKDQQLLPGDRLPSELELAEMMSVSRPVIRSALNALSMLKIVENKKKMGTFVSALEPNQLVEHLELVFSLNDSTYLDSLRVRLVVEPALADFAARNVTNESIRNLESCVEKSRAAINDSMSFLDADFELHKLICDMAKSPILCAFMNSLENLGIHSRKRTVDIPDIRQEMIEDHQAIVTALKLRDPKAASCAMRNHLLHIENRLKQITD